MFKREQNNYQGYQDPQIQRIFYMLEESNRKLRNIHNRLRRIENYLGLRNEDKFDEDIFMDSP